MPFLVVFDFSVDDMYSAAPCVRLECVCLPIKGEKAAERAEAAGGGGNTLKAVTEENSVEIRSSKAVDRLVIVIN